MKNLIQIEFKDIPTIKKHDPILSYCKQLVEEKVPKNSILEIYRNGILAVICVVHKAAVLRTAYNNQGTIVFKRA